jgi:hypothetical protein
MVNRLYNKQVSPKGYMKGGRVNKMGGGMMMKKRPMMKGGKLAMVKVKGKEVPFFAADGKGAKDLGKADRMMAKKGSIPPQLKKFVMAKKKKAKMKKKMKKKVIG